MSAVRHIVVVFNLMQQYEAARKVVLNQGGKTFKVTPEMFFKLSIMKSNKVDFTTVACCVRVFKWTNICGGHNATIRSQRRQVSDPDTTSSSWLQHTTALVVLYIVYMSLNDFTMYNVPCTMYRATQCTMYGHTYIPPKLPIPSIGSHNVRKRQLSPSPPVKMELVRMGMQPAGWASVCSHHTCARPKGTG